MVTSDPPFFLLILGIVMVIISINGALGPVQISHDDYVTLTYVIAWDDGILNQSQAFCVQIQSCFIFSLGRLFFYSSLYSLVQ